MEIADWFIIAEDPNILKSSSPPVNVHIEILPIRIRWGELGLGLEQSHLKHIVSNSDITCVHGCIDVPFLLQSTIKEE